MSDRNQRDRMVLLRQHAGVLISQLTELEELRARVLRAEGRTVVRRTRDRASAVLPRAKSPAAIEVR